MRNNNYWLYSAITFGMLIGIGSMLMDEHLNKKDCPKQEGCTCISPREVLRINAKYETYIDSLSYNGRKSQHKRYQDSIDKFNLILKQ